MSNKYYGRNSKVYSLKESAFASGGEGNIYKINGDNESVAKIYKDHCFKSNKYMPDPRKYLEEKIETMLELPVNPYIEDVLCIAYPTDFLKDEDGKFVGYVMPKINADRCLFTVLRQRCREVFFDNYTYRHSVVIAYNMAYIINRLHQAGIVIGDLNPSNFLVNKDGTIVVVDVDSFNVINRKTGKEYKCKVGVSEMLPPELQGKNLNDSCSKYNVHTDEFGMAILIFLLLMENKHPFSIQMPTNIISSSYIFRLDKNIIKGSCPYVTDSEWKSNIPICSPDINMLPRYIRVLFDKTFTYNESNAKSEEIVNNRTCASEWVLALGRMICEMENPDVYKVCKVNHSHIYRRDYGSCPFCNKTIGSLIKIKNDNLSFLGTEMPGQIVI